MFGFKLLLGLQWKMVRNGIREKGLVTFLAQVLLIIAGLVGFSWFLHRIAFSRSAELFSGPGAWVIFGFLFLWVFMVVLVQGLKNLAPYYYKSPDLTWLITTPLPGDQVFAYKFFAGTLKAVKDTAFLSIPFLAAASWAASMEWFYFPLLIVLVIIFSLTPSAISVVMGLAALRVMSVKLFGSLITVLNILATAFLWAGVWNIESIETLTRVLLSDWADLIPMVAGGKIVAAMIESNLADALIPSLAILGISLVSLALTFVLSRHLFYQGWLNVQDTSSSSTTRARRSSKAVSKLLPSLVFTEWRFAIRNHDLLPGFAMMIGIFAVMIIPFARGKWFEASPEAALYMVLLAAVALPVLGVIVLFVPMEAAKDTKLLKGRFQLIKSLAIGASTVFAYRTLRIFAPAAIIGGLGIVILSVFLNINPGLALIAMIILQLGFTAVHEATELYYHSKLEKSYPIAGELVCWVGIIVYLVLAGGPIMLWAAQDIFTIFFTPSLALSVALLLVVSAFTLWATRELAIYSWDEMEFE